MIRFNPIFDVPLLVLAYFATLIWFLVWVHRTEQSFVPKTSETTNMVTLRLAVVVTTIAAFCYLTGIASWFLFLVIGGISIFGLVSEIIGIVALPVFAAGTLAREYILGFPNLILKPQIERSDSPNKEESHAMLGRGGSTDGPLRPQGNILIDGQQYHAISDNGRTIPCGALVKVIGVRDGVLKVCESKNDG